MCLAVPGRIMEVVDESNRLDGADGSGIGPGDWVLVHVGFAISKIDEEEAMATRRLLEEMGAEYEQELAELRESVIE